jgi:hypothetical protein
VTQRFTALARRLKVACRLHDLRHFLVTQLITSGVDVRTVSGRFGHRDGGRTTLGTYAHFQAAQDRQAAELMERLLRLPAASAPHRTAQIPTRTLLLVASCSPSRVQEHLDRLPLIHCLVAGAGLLKRQFEIEDLARVDLVVPDQVDQLG